MFKWLGTFQLWELQSLLVMKLSRRMAERAHAELRPAEVQACRVSRSASQKETQQTPQGRASTPDNRPAKHRAQQEKHRNTYNLPQDSNTKKTCAHRRDTTSYTQQGGETKEVCKQCSTSYPDPGKTDRRNPSPTINSRALPLLTKWVLLSTTFLCVYTHLTTLPPMLTHTHYTHQGPN